MATSEFSLPPESRKTEKDASHCVTCSTHHLTLCHTSGNNPTKQKLKWNLTWLTIFSKPFDLSKSGVTFQVVYHVQNYRNKAFFLNLKKGNMDVLIYSSKTLKLVLSAKIPSLHTKGPCDWHLYRYVSLWFTTYSVKINLSRHGFKSH